MAAEARERAERETHNAAEVAGIAAGEAPIAAEERPLNWKHNCGNRSILSSDIQQCRNSIHTRILSDSAFATVRPEYGEPAGISMLLKTITPQVLLRRVF